MRPTSLGYLVGYAHLANTRFLVVISDSGSGGYELLFSFSSPEEKSQFLDLVRSNKDLGSDYIENDFMSPTTEEIRDARPLVALLPEDVFIHAMPIATCICIGKEDDRAVS